MKSRNDKPASMHALDVEFRRCRRRAARRWRIYQATDETLDPAAVADAHRVWSDTVSEALKIAETISRHQAHDVAELAAQFEAAWWWLAEDDSILDAGAKRLLQRFRRSLRRLAA